MAENTTKTNLLDRAIGYFAPSWLQSRIHARLRTGFMATVGSYVAGSMSRRSLKGWNPLAADADSDILYDLDIVRRRSRDAIRNIPLAAGIINTKVTNVIGAGLALQSRIDRETISMSDEEAETMEKQIEREWRLFWNTPDVDAQRTITGNGITSLVYRQAKENGEVFVYLPRIERRDRPYSLALQIIEADRICNANNIPDTRERTAGVYKDEYSAPVAYDICRDHPGNQRYYDKKTRIWDKVPAFSNATGLRNVIHVYKPLRPGQTRGMPDLAAVIEPLKQLGRYTDAELMAAVIAAMFTVFIKSASGDESLAGISDSTTATGSTEMGRDTTTGELKLGNGAIVGLGDGEEIQIADPKRPNTAFDPFWTAIVREIGTAVEVPYEMVIKHFTASYSASRAAMLEAWKYFITERLWLAEAFCQIIFEIFMYEAVALERIAAPGFFSDALIRKAYCGANWIGPAKGMIDELKEANAAAKRIETGISNIAEETIAMTGGDWERNHPQTVKELKARRDAGLSYPGIAGTAPAAPADAPNNPNDNGGSDREDI